MINSLSGQVILVVGDIMLDQYIKVRPIDKSTSRYPHVYECNPKNNNAYKTEIGGAGNVAHNISATGAKAILIGMIGKDLAGMELERLIGETDIEADFIKEDECSTTLKQRISCEKFNSHDFENIRIDVENRTVCPSEPKLLSMILKHVDRGVDAIVISDYGKGMFCNGSIVENIISQVSNKYGIPILVDPKQVDKNVYKGATLIKPNHHELDDMLEINIHNIQNADMVKKCQRQLITECGINHVLITRKDKGMILIQQNGHTEYKPKSFCVIDSNGAGDTVMAAMAIGASLGLTYQESAHIASCAAAQIIVRDGTSTINFPGLVKKCLACKSCENWIMHIETQSYDSKDKRRFVRESINNKGSSKCIITFDRDVHEGTVIDFSTNSIGIELSANLKIRDGDVLSVYNSENSNKNDQLRINDNGYKFIAKRVTEQKSNVDDATVLMVGLEIK